MEVLKVGYCQKGIWVEYHWAGVSYWGFSIVINAHQVVFVFGHRKGIVRWVIRQGL